MKLAYFDHNIADAILKGRAAPVQAIINKLDLVPVYSDENIKEIQNTPDREEEFMELFSSLNAMRIFEEIIDFKFTGNILVSDQNIFHRVEEIKESPTDDSSMDGLEFIRKYYGGVDNMSFQQVLTHPLIEQQRVLEGALLEREELDAATVLQIESSLAEIPNTLALLNQAAEELDQEAAGDKALVAKMEDHIKQGPVQLNNIDPPDVLEKIWRLVGQYLGAPERTLEQFFGIGMDMSFLNLGIRNQEFVNINSILNNLNMIGYHRDSNLDEKQRFEASWSDAEHSCYASRCHVFFCNDKRLRKKTIAALEYLKINVPIIQVSGKNVAFHASWMKD